MLRLNVEGMHCGGCAGSVTRAIQTLDPLAQIRVDRAARTVEADTAVDAGLILTAIKDAGFSATLL
jgi:copper chaperone